MQIQGTGEVGSTERKFHLSGVPLIESRLYFVRPSSNSKNNGNMSLYEKYCIPEVEFAREW